MTSGAARGRKVRDALIEHLSRTFDAPTVVATGSGTQALQLAMELAPAFNRGPAVVALPAYSCFDLVSAAVGAGVRVRFYDIDPVTLSPDMDHLRTVIREGVTAVVASSLYGYPIDWTSVRAECSTTGAFLIEDAAQGLGTAGDDVGGGRFGNVSVLSFGRGKGWTGGGGGALLIREAPEHGDVIRKVAASRSDFGLRKTVITTAAWMLGRPALYGIPASIPWLGLGETVYKDPTTPREISSFCAALAKLTAVSATEAVIVRRDVAAQWDTALGASAGAFSTCSPMGGPSQASFLRYALVLRDPTHVSDLIRATGLMGAARGYPTALDQLPQTGQVRSGTATRALPGAQRLAATLVTLPTHHWVTPREIGTVASQLSSLSDPFRAN